MKDFKKEVLEELYLQHECKIVEIEELLNQAKWLSDTIYNHYVESQAYNFVNPFDDNVIMSNNILNNIILTLMDKVDILDKSLNVLDNNS